MHLRTIIKNCILLVLLSFVSACSTTRKPFYLNPNDAQVIDRDKKDAYGKESPLIHSLYLIGDTGDPDKGTANPVLTALEQQLDVASEESSLVFLGNQVYHQGLPKKQDNDRQLAEVLLQEQLDILSDYKGNSYFISGQKDWNNGREGGLKAVRRQEDYIESYFEGRDNIKMYPGKGCADPKVVKVDKDLVFLFLNTQWWIQNWSNEKGINEGCDIQSRYDLLQSIQEEFVKYKNDQIVVFMHHPIVSNGVHDGHFSLQHHIFPFKESDNINIPMPVVGSFVSLYRNITGGKQDLRNAHYQELMMGIDQLAKSLRVNVVFAAAHDKGLQHFDTDRIQYIISGGGSKTNRTVKGNGASFTQQAKGFARIDFYKNMEAWLYFYSVDELGKAQQIYQKQIRAPKPGTVEEMVVFPPVSKTDTTLAASEEFAASKGKEFWLGEQYRDIWSTPVKAPIIDLENQFGGLVPIKKGGGMASNSLRMETESGRQYILRSIKKDYRKLVPSDFTNLKIIDLMKDQNSASHPYGAIVLPPLSEAAGIYYTQPKLVYLQHQRGLLNYNSLFPEELYLLEERPDDDHWTEAANFGNAEEIIGYTDLLEILREKKSHLVDQHWVAKSRLFDLLVHDWDRHDDQWRWAVFEEEDQTVYRPIPRDRDQVFYKFKGALPTYVAWFFVKKFKTMKADLKDVKNQSFNARHFDRYFLNDLEWEEWVPIIEEMQKNITDEVIDAAMQTFPKETLGKDEIEIARLLKSRRDRLLKIGKRLYDYINLEVDIPGTDNDDEFEIETYQDGSVRVQVFVKRKEKKDFLRFDRTFYPKETREIRLFGLRGEDEFDLKGEKNSKIRIRIIGGEDEDEVEQKDNSRKALVYDQIGGMKFEGKGLVDHTSLDIEVNDYDRTSFKYNTSTYFPFFGWTRDDGLWLGGSTTQIINRWRRVPYAAKHTFYGRIAPGSQNAYQVGYEGHFPDLIGRVDFAPTGQVDFPQYENFFGIGNETENPLLDIQYNWVRMGSVVLSPLLKISSKNGNRLLELGPTFESHRVRLTEGRVSVDEALGFSEEELRRRNYAGLRINAQEGFKDDPVFTTYGFQGQTSFSYLNEWSKGEEVIAFETSIQTYFPLSRSPQIVLANSVGYKRVWGDPQFYQYVDLGNFTGLRGFRNERFRGEQAFYHNIDLRAYLFKWNNNILPMDIGLLGGYDYGRVWVENEDSDTWHNSYTVGLWMNVLGAAVIQPYYSFTEELDLFSFKIGFNF